MNEQLSKSYQKFIDTKAIFIDRINSKSAEQQAFKPSEGAWNMIEVLEHILISETGILSFLKKYPPAESKYKTTLKSRLAYTMLAQLYKSPKKVGVPVNFLHPKGEKTIEDLLKESVENNDYLLATIQDFPNDKMKYSVFKHTVSGPMTFQQTIDFFTNHILHHLHQLNRIEKHANYPK